MSEKIDLAEIDAWIAVWVKTDPLGPVEMEADEVLALIRIARAALTYARSGHVTDRLALRAALEPITDSAEVRSDGE